MTQLQFNLDFEDLKEKLFESNLNDVTKSAFVLILNEYMEKERDNYLSVGAYERNHKRSDYRNGYYSRDFLTQIGRVKLSVPRTRSGDFATDLFERYERADQSFILALLEMVVNGVSTRKVTKIVEQLCDEKVSKSFVSSLTSKLEPVVNEWANRKLDTTYYPYIFVDAMYIKVREHNKVVSKAVYIATAINDDGKREVLGFKVDQEESYRSWKEFLMSLKERGLQSPKLIISDAHKGLKKAISREFVGTVWQRCSVHFRKNVIDKLPKKGMVEVRADIKRIYTAITVQEARQLKNDFVEKYMDNPKIEKAIETLEDGFDESIQYLNEPVKTHPHIRSTNSLERLNQEVRRREKAIRIFPNTLSAFRLIGCILMDYHEERFKKDRLYT